MGRGLLLLDNELIEALTARGDQTGPPEVFGSGHQRLEAAEKLQAVNVKMTETFCDELSVRSHEFQFSSQSKEDASGGALKQKADAL